MYCVVQKVERKEYDKYGTPKEIVVVPVKWSVDGVEHVYYTWEYSDEKFHRPIRTAYKVSIHESYRENGKVKKRQWAIATMGYYSLAEYSAWDCINISKLKKKAEEMGKDYEEVLEMILAKVNPLEDRIKGYFEKTPEYKAAQRNDAIISAHRERQREFEEEYGSDTYRYVYDVFGELRNPDYLEQLKEQKRIRDEYEQKSKENAYERFKQSYSSYSSPNTGNHSDDDKKLLKKFYRDLSKLYHPDATKGSDEAMKLLTRIKEQWGL
jgi:hypothetical protein